MSFRHLRLFEQKKLCLVLMLLSFIILVMSRPRDLDYDEDRDRKSNDHKNDVGRVQIKVYRGPTKHDGFAPWGFWVKQPSDEE